MDKGISIIICCYNSSELLPVTLAKISHLKIPLNTSAELILVDNNSTDNTYSTAKNILSSPGFKMDYKILKQPVQGLSHSRLMGIKNSLYDLIIFCDDDNHLHKDYLEISRQIMDANPGTAVLGGESIPVSSIEFPFWFEKFSKSYASGRQYESDGDVTSERGEIWGAGMVLRKSALDELFSKGFRSILKDRTGEILSSGGDIELCYALRLAGWNIRYDSALKLDHFIHPKKLNWNYLIKLSKEFGIQKVYLDAYTRSNEEVRENAWKEESRKILKKINRTGLLKTAGYKFLKEGNPDILKIEKLLGKLLELYKIKSEYSKNIEAVKVAAWNKSSVIH